MDKNKHSICLNMIVRDEAQVITECLDSVLPYINYWVICDTGSEDNTAEIIQSYFRDKCIPGELHHHQWVDFGHNRTQAFELIKGKADYAWVIDADDYLVGEPDFSSLGADCYEFRYRLGGDHRFWRGQLFKVDLPWSCRGVVHEHAHCEVPVQSQRLPGKFHVVARRLGTTRNQDTKKYARDVALLLGAVKKNPADARSVFYLARSYYDDGDAKNAEKWFRRRVEIGGWAEEAFYAQMFVGLSLQKQGADYPAVSAALLDAWEARPQRAEPLLHLAQICRVNQRWNQAYLFAKQAVDTPFPNEDRLFVDESVWRWRAMDELSIAAYWTQRYDQSRLLCERLLNDGKLPNEQISRVQENLDFAVNKLREGSKIK